ncbi:Y+L amino acid transporter 2 [Smittium mucronatum]|uniref:Y+L amino acid transporter 2 n=1 Tax=Smittium mucronatum TaxID=133383 RepID=A0A1R0GVQ1_9FUNG|nr:Y+L amino acid transporter 2 [Smittium mucronatum]
MGVETTKMGPKRTIGIYSGAAISISQMIGSGIFSTPSSVLALVGSPAVVLILYIAGGIFSLCGALTFIEMGVMFPKNGGTLRYLAHGIPKPRLLLSYLFAWCMILCIRPSGIASNGPVFSKYLIYGIAGGPNLPTEHPWLFAHSDWIYRGVAILAVTTATFICMSSVKWSLRVINALTIVKITLLLFLGITGILLAAGAIKHQKTDNFSRGFKGTNGNVGGYASALNSVFFSYGGWDNVIYVVGEMIDPAKKLPISATLGVGSVTTLYTFAIVAYFSVVPMSVALESKEILAAEFTNRVFGPLYGRIVLPIIISFSVYGNIVALIFGVGRIISTAAEVGYVPFGDKLSKYSCRFKTPVNALAFNWVITIIYIVAPPPGNVFDLLSNLSQYPNWLFYGVAAVGCILMRRDKKLNELRKFKVYLPIAYVLVFVGAYQSIFPFVPFTNTNSSYPYYLSPLLGISVTILGVVPFYLRMYWWADKKGVDYTEWEKEEITQLLDNTSDSITSK